MQHCPTQRAPAESRCGCSCARWRNGHKDREGRAWCACVRRARASCTLAGCACVSLVPESFPMVAARAKSAKSVPRAASLCMQTNPGQEEENSGIRQLLGVRVSFMPAPNSCPVCDQNAHRDEHGSIAHYHACPWARWRDNCARADGKCGQGGAQTKNKWAIRVQASILKSLLYSEVNIVNY
jgi:hypothetical protein